MALGKGIPVINGFDLNSKLPLDSRTVADTKENMNKLVTDGSVGDGQLCYCKADKKLYVLKDTVWSEVGEGGGGGISVIELTDKNGTIASAQLGEINANPQNFAFKYNGKILLFTGASGTTYQYCNNNTTSSDNNVMTTSTLLTIESSTGVYTIAENAHNVVANSIHPVNGGDLTNIQVGSKVYSIPSGGGQAMFDITQYMNDAGDSISQEGYTLLKEGISSGKYAGIVLSDWNAYPIGTDDIGGLKFQYINTEPSSTNDIYKMLIIDKNTLKISGLPWEEGNQNVYIYSSFYIKPYIGGGTSSLPYYDAETGGQQNLTIGDGLTIENGALKATGGGGSGSSKIWYELPSLFFLENITQEQFDAIKNLALQNQLAGINCAGLYCPLTADIDGQGIVFFYPWYENDIFTAYMVRLNKNLSVEKIPYSTITLPQTAPTSQVIPSITTTNTQQNLTIGNGLEIKNGALQATGGGFNIFDNVFSIGVAENINEETFTLTEVGLNKINSMFTNGKLLGLCFEDPANITTDFTFIPFVSFTGDNYWFTGTTYITGTNLQFTQIKINKTTGAIEMVQKLIAATDMG